MSINGYEKTKDAIRKFNARFPRPGITDLVEKLSTIFNPRDPDQWKNPWPNAGAPGVYFIFDDQGDILYIGMATDNIGMRLSKHIKGGSNSDFKQPAWVEELGKKNGVYDLDWAASDDVRRIEME